MKHEKTVKSLEEKGYQVTLCSTGADAVAYLCDSIKGTTVGFGGSQTLTKIDLEANLARNNTVYVPDYPVEGETFYSVWSQEGDLCDRSK